jgi:hypothetical protein
MPTDSSASHQAPQTGMAFAFILALAGLLVAVLGLVASGTVSLPLVGSNRRRNRGGREDG